MIFSGVAACVAEVSLGIAINSSQSSRQRNTQLPTSDLEVQGFRNGKTIGTLVWVFHGVYRHLLPATGPTLALPRAEKAHREKFPSCT